MMTKTSMNHEALQEGWMDVLWSGDEETPNELPMIDSEFEIISHYVPLISRDNVVVTELQIPLHVEPTSYSETLENLYTPRSSIIIYDDKKLDLTQIQQSDGSISQITTTSIEDTSENSTDVVAPELPRPTPAKYNPLMFDRSFGRPPYQPLQQGDATPNEELDTETIVEGPYKSCSLDEVD